MDGNSKRPLPQSGFKSLAAAQSPLAKQQGTGAHTVASTDPGRSQQLSGTREAAGCRLRHKCKQVQAQVVRSSSAATCEAAGYRYRYRCRSLAAKQPLASTAVDSKLLANRPFTFAFEF